jgi:L-alanine-DL-glutamate epimerase-like enolase superfamily enzyme
MTGVRLDRAEISLPFRATVRHASATRAEGASIWVTAHRGAHEGLGEGCPRSYVTGETVASCVQWIDAHAGEILGACDNIRSLSEWTTEHQALIDAAPSAWCAVECALLDLFAREAGVSVEAMVGLGDPRTTYVYTAVLADDGPEAFEATLERYVSAGFCEFKLKLQGELETDRTRLKGLISRCAAQGRHAHVRLDANNLWRDRADEAESYLRALEPPPDFAVEEPFSPGDVDLLSNLAHSLACPIILDESACRLAQLDRFERFPGTLVVNVKASKVGGLLRALRLVDVARTRKWGVIVGAHVGETSVLTRAGMALARAAGSSLVGHEGGYGMHLLQWEPVTPSLMLGPGGRIDLARPVIDPRSGPTRPFTPERWSLGWGLELASSRSPA